MTDKINTSVDAHIISSDTKRYTVEVKVTRADNGEPVGKGNVVITAKKGRLIGEGRVSEDGVAVVTSAITKKDYKLKVVYEENHKFNESSTKIDFKSEYLFYKTSAYLWASILIVILSLIYIIFLRTYLLPNALEFVSGMGGVSYLSLSTSSLLADVFVLNTEYISILINVLIWVFIISLIVASVYALQFNSNLHNIIRKNVTNHDLFKNFIPIMVFIFIVITIIYVILLYLI